MDQRHLQEMADLEENYWWHKAKRQLVEELLKRHAPSEGVIVEGGIGSGRNLLQWQSLGYEVHGFDILPPAIEMAKSRGIEHAQQHDLHEPWPLPEGSVSCVMMLDVLEHMAEPVSVLKHASKVLRPDGVIILTVPAYQWLFGRWDQILGHHRRYTRRMLKQQTQEAGLNLRWCQHWNAFTLPAALAMRTKEKLFPNRDSAEFPRVPNWINSLLLGLARMERAWLLRIGLPVGLSVVGVIEPMGVLRENVPETVSAPAEFS